MPIRSCGAAAAAGKESLVGFLVLATCCCVYALPASSATADQGATLEEVIVTAQRREERIQDVPIAISAFSAEDLVQRGVTDLSSLRGSVPGLSITNTAGVNTSNVLAIRGVGGLPLNIGGGQATGIYLDGVYLARADAAFFSLDDLERIEVLRGPQGTLYGRNATAGAINIVTREPGDELVGGIDLSYGNYGAAKVKGSISGPISGGLSGALSGSFDDRDGFFRNTVTGNEFDTRRSHTIRGKLRYSASEAFSATLTADSSRIRAREVFKNTYAAGVFVGLGNPEEVTIERRNEEESRLRTDSEGIALEMNFAVSDQLDVTSISSYREFSMLDAYRFPAVPPPLQSRVDGGNETFDQELRALITRDNFRATIGGNYYNDKQNWIFQVAPPPATGPLLPLTPQLATSDIKSWALFGQMEYDFNERVTGVLGARFTDENRDWVLDQRSASPAGPLARGTITDSAVTPTVGVNFKYSPDIMLYAKLSKGYLAPGFNSGLNGPTLAIFIASNRPLVFNAEDLLAYEAGIKSQFMDRRVTLNLSAFSYDYEDLQVRSNLGVGPTEPGAGSIVIDNAPKSRVVGLEGMLSANLNDNWTITAQATWLNAEYDTFCQGVGPGTPQFNDASCVPPGATIGANRAGNKLNLAPEFSGGLMAEFSQALAGGRFSANVQYSWESNTFQSPVNEGPISTGGWNRLDARIGFETARGLEVYAFGKNLGDERYGSFIQRVTPTGTFVAISDPRTYGVGVRYRL